uniref:Uncharacterized protein n=1 Tax=Arundo donax TaxID=35708 RepID=A0A0A8ZTU0_ARUDO
MLLRAEQVDIIVASVRLTADVREDNLFNEVPKISLGWQAEGALAAHVLPELVLRTLQSFSLDVV